MDVSNQIERKIGFPDTDYNKKGELKKIRWRVIKKLFAYDFSAQIKPLIPFIIGVLAFSIMAMVYLILCFKYPNSATIILTTVFVVMIFAFGIMSCVISPYVVCVKRYSKNFFGKDGYLVLSLPVSGFEHVLSKFIAFYTTFWLITITIILSLGILSISLFFLPIKNEIIIPQISLNAQMVFSIIEQIIISLISPIAFFFVINSMVCFLSTKTKRQKGWIIFGIVMFFYVFGFTFTGFAFDIFVTIISSSWYQHLTSILEIIFYIALSTGGFIYQAHYLEKKLNLQ